MKFVPSSKRSATKHKPHNDDPLEQGFIDVMHAKIVPPQWVVRQLLPVGLTIVQGPPKVVFKSTITVIMAALVARWQCQALPPWMDSIMWGPSMVFALEAEAGEILWTLTHALRVQPEDSTIWVAYDPWDYKLNTPEGRNKILAWANGHMPRLIILDPFRNMWEGDENDSSAIIHALQPLQAWAKANQASIIVVHHTTKPSEGKDMGSMYAGRGSGALPGLADAILTLEPGNQQGRVIVNAVFKRGAAYRRTIELGVPGFGWRPEGREVLSEQARRVAQAMAGGTTFTDAVADMTGFETIEVQAMLERNGYMR